MNIEKLAPFALALALLASSAGQLPKVINTVRRAEFLLIQDSKASTWMKAPMLNPFKRPLNGQTQ
jgi:hypothetical protein